MQKRLDVLTDYYQEGSLLVYLPLSENTNQFVNLVALKNEDTPFYSSH